MPVVPSDAAESTQLTDRQPAARGPARMIQPQSEPRSPWHSNELFYLSQDTSALIQKAIYFSDGSRLGSLSADVESLALRVLQSVATIVKTICGWELAIIRCQDASCDTEYRLETTHSNYDRQRRLELLCSMMATDCDSDRLIAASNASDSENAVFALTAQDRVSCLNACGKRARRLAGLLHGQPLDQLQAALSRPANAATDSATAVCGAPGSHETLDLDGDSTDELRRRLSDTVSTYLAASRFNSAASEATRGSDGRRSAVHFAGCCLLLNGGSQLSAAAACRTVQFNGSFAPSASVSSALSTSSSDATVNAFPSGLRPRFSFPASTNKRKRSRPQPPPPPPPSALLTSPLLAVLQPSTQPLPVLQPSRPALPLISQSASLAHASTVTASGTRIVTLTPPVVNHHQGNSSNSLRLNHIVEDESELFNVTNGDQDINDDSVIDSEAVSGLGYTFECQFCRCRLRVADREGMLGHYRLCCEAVAGSAGVAASWPGRAFECPECCLLFESLLALNEHVRYSCEAIGQQFYELEQGGANAESRRDEGDADGNGGDHDGGEIGAAEPDEVCVISDSSSDD